MLGTTPQSVEESSPGLTHDGTDGSNDTTAIGVAPEQPAQPHTPLKTGAANILAVLVILVVAGAAFMFGKSQTTVVVVPADNANEGASVTNELPQAQAALAQAEATSQPSQVQATPVVGAIPADWVQQKLPTVGISFYVPKRVAALGTIKEEIFTSEVDGSVICGQFEKPSSFRLIPQVYAGGGCSTAPNPYLRLGTSSVGMSFGRELGFTDFQGYQAVGDTYAAKFNDRTFDLSMFGLEEIQNQHGVSILKVKGVGPGEDGPSLQNALNKDTALIIRGTKTLYPGLVIVLKEGGLTSEEIDTLVQSIQQIK